MNCKCLVCKRDFVFDAHVGYDRDLCGPMCDGVESGRRGVANLLIVDSGYGMSTLELLEHYEGSQKVEDEGHHPTVRINAEDFAEILRGVRAAVAKAKEAP